MTAPVRADRDRTLWGPAKNLFGLLREQLRRAWEAILLERVTELRNGLDEAL